MKINLILPAFLKIYKLLSVRHRVYLFVLIFMTIGFSLVETVGVTAIMPFIAISSDPASVESGIYKIIYDLFGNLKIETFLIYFGIAIIVFYIIRAVYNIAHTYLINRFSFATSNSFQKKLFNIFMSMPYFIFVQKNSGELVSIINSEARNLSAILNNILLLFTEIFTITLIYAVMLIVNYKMTLVLTVILAVFVVLFLFLIIKKSKSLGKKRLEANIKTFKILMEAFGNYKFVRLKGNKKDLGNRYNASILQTARTTVTSQTLGVVPKSTLESLGFSMLIAAVLIILVTYNDTSMVIPIISMYALALYRILPSIHRLLGNINQISFMLHCLDRVDDALKIPVENEGNTPVNFEEIIKINNVSFKYATGDEVIENVSLEIKKGEKVAITGGSGSGKTTLIDLIIGVHKPITGDISIDGVVLCEENICSWRKKIGYIPQSIYLIDGTVGENVAYGSECNEEKIINALKKANIWDFLQEKDGINTKVGEGGIQLSGGQQQRIGIARAMYNDPEILVLDEATSSLDNETEAKIMDEIYNASMNKTLIVIAHRLSTVEHCQRRLKMTNGRIEEL